MHDTDFEYFEHFFFTECFMQKQKGLGALSSRKTSNSISVLEVALHELLRSSICLLNNIK